MCETKTRGILMPFILPAFENARSITGRKMHRHPEIQRQNRSGFEHLPAFSTVGGRSRQLLLTFSLCLFFSFGPVFASPIPRGHDSAQALTKPIISNASFERSGGTLGRWRGRLRGQGKIHLRLYLFDEKRRLLGRKYMGYVRLQRSDGAIPFLFESVVPSEQRWKWVIRAFTGR